MSVLKFTVPGAARGKGRPKAARRGQHIQLYTDEKTASYEGLVAHAGRIAMAGRPLMDGPVTLQLHVLVAPPASVSKRKRASMLAGSELPAKKPDLSNILKSIEDGLNGVAYRDDAQIVAIVASKSYADAPCALVTVSPVGGIIPWSMPLMDQAA